MPKFPFKKKEDVFSMLFSELIETLSLGCKAFIDLLSNYEDVEKKVDKIKKIEKDCDNISHKILNTLYSTFITPIEREDIFTLTGGVDDIMDMLEEVSASFWVFNIKRVKPEAMQMAKLIIDAVEEIKVLFLEFPNIKRNDVIKKQIEVINSIEDEGDTLHRNALKKLFEEENDPLEIIKWKQIFEHLEDTIDACEDVAEIIEGIVSKQP